MRSPTRFSDSGSRTRTLAVLGLVLGITIGAPPAAAQDVELWGEIHGTRPPDAYYEELRENPDAYRFGVEGSRRTQEIRASNSLRVQGAIDGGAPGARNIGPYPGGAVVGTFRFPVILGTYSDGPSLPPYSPAEVQTHFFDGPNPQGPTIPEYYDEVSGGLVTLEGVTYDWVQTGHTRSQVTLNNSGLSRSETQGIGAFIEDVVLALDDQGVDWSQFDSTGDGYVDVLTVIHPDRGAECDGSGNEDRIWSHRWTLADATDGRLRANGTGSSRDGLPTSTPHPGGGFIHVNDYTVQPLLSCQASPSNPRIAEIGTFAHELGHGFGLPDLYRTSGSLSTFYAGAGNWDLMGTGSYGCGGASPELPCHMGAWTKDALGWVSVEDVQPDTHQSVSLEPVETTGRVLKLEARDGSGDYLLLENRQRIGTDAGLSEPGLLVWQIDQVVLDATWVQGMNRVNNDPERMAVWLRQADGRDDLTRVGGGRGDPGDPFPGCIKDDPLDYNRPEVPCGENDEFHAGRAPFALSHLGEALGVTLTEIEGPTGGPGNVTFELDTRIFDIVVEAEEDGVPVSVPGFELDGEPRGGTPFSFTSAPFQEHELIAAGGISTGPGERIGFVGWNDGGPRVRDLTAGFENLTLTAAYGEHQIRLGVSTNEPVAGIAPGTFLAQPGDVEPEGSDFWFPPGTSVSVTATPRTGFTFLEWVGLDSPGESSYPLTLDEPTEITATFDVVYAFENVEETVAFEAAAPQDIYFEVSDANDPVVWSVVTGAIPPGMSFSASNGHLTGAAVTIGEFPVEIRAVDAIGLETQAAVLLDVKRPNLGLQQLSSTFVAGTDELSFLQKQFLDGHGNGDGSYDVGDFRAWVLANPGLPETVSEGAPAQQVVPLGPARVPEVGR